MTTITTLKNIPVTELLSEIPHYLVSLRLSPDMVSELQELFDIVASKSYKIGWSDSYLGLEPAYMESINADQLDLPL